MTDPPPPAARTVRRIRIVSLLVLGAFIPLLLNTVMELATFHASPGEAAALHHYAVNGTMLAGEVLAMAIAYRVARYSKLPGAPAILLLMSLVVATVLASHFF